MIHSVFVISSFLYLRCWSWLFAMKKYAVRLSTLYTSSSVKLSTSASVVLLRFSHWLYDIFWSISNSVNLFLMNFSRAGYPGQFLHQCTMHSRLVVSHTSIAIKSLYVMSNFGNSMFLSSDSSDSLFKLVFTDEQKQPTRNLVFWWWIQTHTVYVTRWYSHPSFRTKLT